MNRPGNSLPQDLAALRYLDSVDAGDLETVAALWNAASRDPNLERMLTELDSALADEETGASRKSATRSIRRTDQLAPTRGHSTFWLGAVAGLATVCLLSVLVWLGGRGMNRVVVNPNHDSNPPSTPGPLQEFPANSAWHQARHAVDGAETPVFAWPIQETPPPAVSTSIPADLLD